MGEALPLNIAPQTTQTSPASALPPNVQALAVTVLYMPSDFPDVTRPVQISGLLQLAPLEGEVSLQTGAGIFTVAPGGAQGTGQAAEAVRQSLAELLQPLIGSSRPITLVMQPATDGVTILAHLMVPKPDQAATKTLSSHSLETGQRQTSAPSFTEGKSFAVTILPGEMDADFLTLAQKASNVAQMQPDTTLLSLPVDDFIEQTVEGATQKLTALAEAFIKKVHFDLPHPVGDVKVATGSLEPLQTPPSGGQAHPLTPGQDATLRIDRILTPKADWPVDLSAGQMKATVVGNSPTGQALLSSEGQTLYVRQEGSLPVGTRAVVTLMPSEQDKQIALPLPRESDFSSMREVVSAMTTLLEPKDAQGFLQTRLPNPTHHLGPTLLFFLSALQAGKLDDWLGPSVAVRFEKEQRRHLIDKLVGDIEEAALPAQDARVGEWKAWPIPIHYGASFEMLRLYVHEDETRRDAEGKTVSGRDKTRFLITMNMSRLGAIQMDGLSQSKRLDLVIRSERALPPALPNELRSSYIHTLEALGLTGTMSFQSGRQDWVHIAPASKPPATYA